MSVTFSQIPDALLVPGQYQEIDNSLAGALSDVKKVLIVGLKTAAGTAVAGVPVTVSNPDQARKLAGAGSPLALMAVNLLDLDKVEEIDILPLSEKGGSVAATKTLTFTVAALQAGTFTRYVAGIKVSIAVAAADTPTIIAAAFVAAVNASLDMPYVASAVAGVVTLTSVVKGEVGNYLDVAAALAGEVDPSGLTAVLATGVTGTLNPDLTPTLTALGDVRYHYFVTDLVDAAGLTSFSNELADRYTANRQIGGRLFAGISGAVGNAGTAGTLIYQGQSINTPHIVMIPRGQNIQPPSVWVSRIAAVAIRTLADDPSANTSGLSVPGLMITSKIIASDRQKLLAAGVATWEPDAVGGVLIERLVTTYTRNAQGAGDTSYLDVQIPETIESIRTHINGLAFKKYSTWKLASTNENFGPGAKVMTPEVWRSFLVETYSEVFIKEKQWCQDLESYKASLIIEVKSGSKTRLNYRHQPVLIGQFLISAGLNQFK